MLSTRAGRVRWSCPTTPRVFNQLGNIGSPSWHRADRRRRSAARKFLRASALTHCIAQRTPSGVVRKIKKARRRLERHHGSCPPMATKWGQTEAPPWKCSACQAWNLGHLKKCRWTPNGCTGAMPADHGGLNAWSKGNRGGQGKDKGATPKDLTGKGKEDFLATFFAGKY